MLLAFPSTGSAQPAPPRQIKFALQGTAGSAPHEAAVRFAQDVKSRSHGRLEIRLFAGGVLGNDLAVISAVRGGTIEMSVLNASLLAGVARPMSLFDFPFLFDSEREAHAVIDGPFGQRLHDLLEPRGLIGLCYWGVGVRHFHNGRRAIRRVEDLQGLKMRVVESPIYLDFMAALGAQPMPMPFPELRAALESGAVDGGTQPISAMVNARLHEVQRHVTLTGHVSNPQSVIVSRKFWEGLPAADRQILLEAARSVRADARRALVERDAQGMATLKKAGLEIHALDATELARMRALAQQVIAMHTPRIGASLVRELHAAQEEARQEARQELRPAR
ncbi:TRAP transporter substrate-binding protein DctP [Sphaerotilus mobilis]|uniref:TRAP transporter substrate-binding protein DctP n=1 Tax=Sphaerotilus mobilis TaxID=47994 RepID=UPI0013EEA6ED|nr:TRAP transporter substrate-binding protein DctP [Sphaerotilus mobilis]